MRSWITEVCYFRSALSTPRLLSPFRECARTDISYTRRVQVSADRASERADLLNISNVGVSREFRVIIIVF